MGSVLNVDRHVDMLVPQIQGMHGRKGRILPERQLVDVQPYGCKVSTRNAVVEAKNVDFRRFYVSEPSYVVTISRRYATERPSWTLPEMLGPDVG